MVDAREICIRVLAEGAGDKASMHAMNVGIISLLMGRCFGFSAEEIQDLGVGAMLHDIGKLELPVRLRHREDNFSPSELRVYQEHVETGLVQAKRMGLSAGATAVIAQHHEHADGSGFPAGLNSDRMTMAARIVALVNRYDNLCNPRLPARALTPHEALSLLFAQGRSKFDTSILGAFIKMMGVYPPGSTVQLTDDRYGTVVAVNSSRPLKPTVLVHDPAVPREEALVLDLESAVGLGIRRSIKAQQLPPTALDYLAPSPRVAYFFEPATAPGDRDPERARRHEQPPAGRPVQRRRRGPPHLAAPDRVDARGGLPGRARGAAHRRRQRPGRPAARRGAGRPGRPRHARARGHARGRVLLARGRRQREREHRLRLVRRPPRRRRGAGDAPGEPDRAGARAPPSTSWRCSTAAPSTRPGAAPPSSRPNCRRRSSRSATASW